LLLESDGHSGRVGCVSAGAVHDATACLRRARWWRGCARRGSKRAKRNNRVGAVGVHRRAAAHSLTACAGVALVVGWGCVCHAARLLLTWRPRWFVMVARRPWAVAKSNVRLAHASLCGCIVDGLIRSSASAPCGVGGGLQNHQYVRRVTCVAWAAPGAVVGVCALSLEWCTRCQCVGPYSRRRARAFYCGALFWRRARSSRGGSARQVHGCRGWSVAALGCLSGIDAHRGDDFVR
jgi:hypothetical protein